jgi:hypothetical protein
VGTTRSATPDELSAISQHLPILTGSSWAASRMTILCSVAVSFICGWTTDRVSTPRHVREFYQHLTLSPNSAIHTGAFRTSRVKSVHRIGGTCTCHSLTNSTVQLCCKAGTLKKNPSYEAVHQLSLQQRYALNPKASRLAGIRFKELLDALHISTPPVIPSKTPTTPPFVIDSP